MTGREKEEDKENFLHFTFHRVEFRPQDSESAVIPRRLVTELRPRETIVDLLSRGEDKTSEQSLGDFLSNRARPPRLSALGSWTRSHQVSGTGVCGSICWLEAS